MSKKLSKEERITQEYERLSAVFADVEENKRKTAEGIIQNAAFMCITLEDLQAQINKDGAVIETTNGNGFVTKQEHPAQKSYNTMINRYNSALRQLTELAPATPAKTESKLSAFLDNE